MKEAFDILQKNKDFLAWKKANPSETLAHCFHMIHKDVKDCWQFGYYNATTDKIITFVCEGESVTIQPPTDVFKDPAKKILPLSLTGVKIDFAKALEIASHIMSEKHPGQKMTTTIVILQNIAAFGVVWNLTLVTAAFYSLNVKIDAKTGEIKSSNFQSLTSLIQKE